MKLGYVLEVPESLVRSDRLHNRIVRELIRDLLEEHHRKTLPLHFLATARDRYGYMPRTDRYKARKMRKWKSRTDLVASGKSRDYILHNKTITVSGAAAKGNVIGTLRTRFNFPGGTGRSRGGRKGVTPAEMVKEVSKILPVEQDAIASKLAIRYIIETKNNHSRALKRKIGV